jgi:hypothetical protein
LSSIFYSRFLTPFWGDPNSPSAYLVRSKKFKKIGKMIKKLFKCFQEFQRSFVIFSRPQYNFVSCEILCASMLCVFGSVLKNSEYFELFCWYSFGNAPLISTSAEKSTIFTELPFCWFFKFLSTVPCPPLCFDRTRLSQQLWLVLWTLIELR